MAKRKGKGPEKVGERWRYAGGGGRVSERNKRGRK